MRQRQCEVGVCRGRSGAQGRVTSSKPFQDSLYGDLGVLVGTGRSGAALECNHTAGDAIGATTDGCPNFERGPGSVAQLRDNGSNGLLDVADLLRVSRGGDSSVPSFG